MNPYADEIETFITGAPEAQTEAAFDRAALGLFAYQYAHSAPYRALCDALGASPDSVAGWRDVPAVPAAAFKEFDLSCAPLAGVVRTFHSSGTTGRAASRHHLCADALALYDTSLRRGFDMALGRSEGRLLWALMPPPNAAPNSSLSYMLGALWADQFYWDDTRLLRSDLAEVERPVVLFGTAFAFVNLFDACADRWSLPPGSAVVETGGFKGRSREVPREELYATLSERFGVPLDQCYSEYGMSEMASQYYGRGLDPVKRAPPWLRARIIDPVTGEDQPLGTPGILRHYDLANLNSAFVIETEDAGVRTEDGFILLGRAQGAELRGCSLTAEELMA
jgi:phenylacetate-coenzyme A ligase PaaK-like adenylate-forming protein